MLVLRMSHRKWKETKQQPSMLLGAAVPGCCLVSFHILWVILSTSTIDIRRQARILERHKLHLRTFHNVVWERIKDYQL